MTAAAAAGDSYDAENRCWWAVKPSGTMPTLSTPSRSASQVSDSLEHGAVVDAGHQHDLDVEVDSGVEQLVEALERTVLAARTRAARAPSGSTACSET